MDCCKELAPAGEIAGKSVNLQQNDCQVQDDVPVEDDLEKTLIGGPGMMAQIELTYVPC